VRSSKCVNSRLVNVVWKGVISQLHVITDVVSLLDSKIHLFVIFTCILEYFHAVGSETGVTSSL